MALLNLVYRDQLFPRQAYRRTFDALPAAAARKAGLPHHRRPARLAHDRGCEAELADLLAADLEAGRLPDMTAICAHFAPDPARLPHVVVHLVPLTAYEDLLGSGYRGATA